MVFTSLSKERLKLSKENLEDEDLLLLTDPVAKAKQNATTSVPWLMRTEYISTERNVYGRAGAEAQYIIFDKDWDFQQ
jgi:hypothetical protein